MVLPNKKCKLRLIQLNHASKPSPTKLTGSQVSRENYIRKRVAKINVNKTTKKMSGYGPLFGLAKKPKYGGDCNDIYYANGGTGSDIVQWKRIYGGSRTLFSTKSCNYGCED